jgi:hypothetical protein
MRSPKIAFLVGFNFTSRNKVVILKNFKYTKLLLQIFSSTILRHLWRTTANKECQARAMSIESCLPDNEIQVHKINLYGDNLQFLFLFYTVSYKNENINILTGFCQSY